MGGVGNDARGGKGKMKPSRDPAGNMGLHVHGRSTCRSVQVRLLHRFSDDGIGSENRSSCRPRKASQQAPGPGMICRDGDDVVVYGGRDNPMAGTQFGREATGNTDADDAPRFSRESVERGLQMPGIAPSHDDRQTWAIKQPSLALQPGGDEDRHRPCGTRRLPARLRLR